MLAVEPISLADAAFLGPTAEGQSSLRGQAASISADGQLVVFQSAAADLVPNDFNNATDIFVFNRSTGQTTLISENAAGTASGAGGSFNPKISPDWRFILYESEATDLTADTIISGPGQPDIFLRDLQNETTTLVSKSASGTTGSNRASFNARITPDGRFVVFESNADNLAANDTNGERTDVFVRDLQTETTTLISRTPAGQSGNDNSFDARISDNGGFIAFTSFASDLIANDQTTIEDIFLYDVQTGIVELISVDSDEVNQSNVHNALSPGRAISADGRYVIFETNANNLVPQIDDLQGTNIYLRDRQLGTTNAVTISANATTATGGVAGNMTPDGRFVAFVSGETDLVNGINDTNGTVDVFLRDLQTGTTRVVSLNAAGVATGNRISGTAQYPFDFSAGAPVLSDDGRFVAFASEASDLVAGLTDNNDSAPNQPGEQPGMRRRDVFVRDMQAGSTTLVSMNGTGTGTGNNGSYTPAMSADGRVFAFEGHASDLVAGSDIAGFVDVFVRDLNTASTELASQRTALFPAERLRGGTLGDVTADGRFVALVSAGTIVPNVPLEFGPHLYVRDRVTGEITVEDIAGGVAREGFPRAAQLSDDGRFVVFSSFASLDPNVSDPNRRGQLYVRDRQAGTTRMVTVTTAGQASEGIDLGPRDFAFSPGGRYVAFTTQSGGLVDGFTDNNGSAFGLGRDVFIRDLVGGTTRLVSHVPASTTSGGNGSSFWPLFSADGTKLAFASLATDLAPGVADSNGAMDLFVYDIATTQIEAASVATAGAATGSAASGDAGDFAFSADGRYLFFGSFAGDLVPGDNNSVRDIFRRDLVADSTALVSASSSGAPGNNHSYGLSVGASGNIVAFTSDSNDLAPGDNNSRSDVFLRDIEAGTTTLVSADRMGVQGNRGSHSPRLSPDGSHVAFLSDATNLVPDFIDINSEFRTDLFVRRIADGATALVTSSNSGITGSDAANSPNTIQFVGNDVLFFDSDAGNLFNGDRNAVSNVFAYTVAGAARITGRVFSDDNGNGSQDGSETGIPFWTVYSDANGNNQFDAGELNRQTDLAGNYAFGDLVAGTYSVAVDLPEGFAISAPVTGSHTVTLISDTATLAGRNFGVVQALTDLVVMSVTAPATVGVGRHFTVDWTVRNNATQALTGDWQDAVYLSQDDLLDAGDRLLGVVPHTGGLSAGASYSQSLEVQAPPVEMGNYRVIVIADRRRQVENDVNRATNVGVSGNVALSIPQLTLGVPFADEFTAPNQARYYQITVSPGESMLLTLDSAAAMGSTELYLRRGNLPTPWEFDLTSRIADEPDQELVVPLTEAGTYFVLAQSRSGDAATEDFTITASLPGFTIRRVTADQGEVNTTVTVKIEGTGFTPQTMVSIAGRNAVVIDFEDPSVLYATFNLLTFSSGVSDVVATDGANVATLEDGFEIVFNPFASAALPEVQLIVPEFVRPGREGTAVIKYANRSNSDMLPPVLELVVEGALLRLPEHSIYSGSSLSLLGVSMDGPAGILRPGQEEQIVVKFLATEEGDAVNFELRTQREPNAFIDLESLKEPNRPAAVSPEAWDAIWDNVRGTFFGSTVEDFQEDISGIATYLGDLGTYTQDLRRLFNFAISEAGAALPGATLASSVDGSMPTTGIPLLFTRGFDLPIASRYRLGPLGRGWRHNWEIFATADADGNVSIDTNGTIRFFIRQADGCPSRHNSGRLAA